MLIEQIMPNFYKVKIPLPENPLKAINSYVIKARTRNLIIDTGMNREECILAMHSGLQELDVDLRETDFFVTHLHADHSGLVAELATETSCIYCSQQDADIINSGTDWDAMVNFARLSGFPENKLREAIDRHPGYRYNAKGHLDFDIVAEGDVISIGDYLFKCVETPGHTRGHMCLYEEKHKILVAGDHVLADITPNISLWSDDRNPLDEYVCSLDKVYELDIRLVLPGHRSLIKDCRKRIQELKHHHQTRINEIISLLEKGSRNAYKLASEMTWDLTYDSWEEFPVSQKLFATGEAIAHLKYLEEKGVIRREIKGEKIVFSLAS